MKELIQRSIRAVMLCLAMVLVANVAVVQAQTTPVKNPGTVEWECADHDADFQHELKIVRIEGTNKVIITTILLGDPAYSVPETKTVRTDLNVQPIAFGEYVATMSAHVRMPDTTVVKSDESAESNRFQRAPGAPAKLTLGAKAGGGQ